MEKSQIKINYVYCYNARDRKFFFTAMVIEEKGVRPYPFSCLDKTLSEILETPKRVLTFEHIIPVNPELLESYVIYFEEKLNVSEEGEVLNPDCFREEKEGKTLIVGDKSPVREDPELAKAKKELEEEMNKPAKAAIETNHNPGKELKRLMMLNKQGGDVRQYEFSFIVYGQLPPRMYEYVYQALQELENFLNVNQLLQFKDPTDKHAQPQNFVYEINKLPSHTVRPHERPVIKNAQIEELLGNVIVNYNTKIRLEEKELDAKFTESDETPGEIPTFGYRYDINEKDLDKYCIVSFAAKCDRKIPSGEIHVKAGGNDFICLNSPDIDSMMTGHKFIGRVGVANSDLQIYKNINPDETSEDFTGLIISDAKMEIMTESQYNDFMEAEKKRLESI